ncbi:uncharacterized protein LOC128735972 [Sabethes cyaneus]|uniref:uncharacterized protein LOC128735972 n=1 Tax=Sabethes cyaneus TaxID=53552 RepID=UPI00237E7B36|nr:uncharacterized protein LOC128735972 [Sabethes cyaneus]
MAQDINPSQFAPINVVSLDTSNSAIFFDTTMKEETFGIPDQLRSQEIPKIFFNKFKSCIARSDSFPTDITNKSYFDPKLEALIRQETTDEESQPIFPERSDAVYFVIALHGGSKVWSRTLARTLLDLGVPFSNPQGPPLRPIILDLPPNGRYSSKVLTTLCELIDSTPLAGMIVIGNGQSANMIALAGSSMKIPVLWAKGGIASIHEFANELMSKSQAILQPSSREILDAIQSLLIQAHWNSFYILSDVKSTILLSGKEGYALKRKPLRATILPIPNNDNLIYKQLAKVSQSTRGVVILLCELHVARLILSEAQQMRMFNGHFIWLWADTTTTTEFHDPMLKPFGLFGASPEEDTHAQLYFLNSDTEEDFYDATDIVQQSHIADLIDRKMDFEIFDYKQKRNRTKIENRNVFNVADSNEVNPANEYLTLADGKHDTRQNIGNSYNIYQDNLNLSILDSSPSNGDLIKNMRTNKIVKNNVTYQNIFEGATHGSIIENDSNQRQSAGVRSLFEDQSVEENSFADIKIKRADIFRNYYNVSSHVLFHHFQDFPIGLLAMRPMMMKVDRHFIRSTVRLFASTWAKVEQNVENNKKLLKDKSFDKHKKYKRSAKNYEIQSSTDSSIEVNLNDVLRNKVNSNIIRHSNDKANNKIKSITEKRIKTAYDSNDKLFISKISKSFLNSSIQSNNTPVKLVTVPSKLKRQQTWWSSKGYKSLVRGKDRTNTKGGAPRYQNGCYGTINHGELKKAELFTRYLQESAARSLKGQPIMAGYVEKSLITHFEILNLVPAFKLDAPRDVRRDIPKNENMNQNLTKWRRVGLISGKNVHLDTIVWPSGDIVVTGLSSRARSVFRVVVALAPPFVMVTEQSDNERCLRGVICYQMLTSGRQNISRLFNNIESQKRSKKSGVSIESKEDEILKKFYSTRCCFGLSMDLLQKIAEDVGFEFDLYIVHDGLFGRKISISGSPQVPLKASPKRIDLSKFDAQSGRSLKRGSKLSKILELGLGMDEMYQKSKSEPRLPKLQRQLNVKWNGVIGDLISGSADMSFAPLSVSRERAQVIDFSVPFFHGGISLLAAPQTNPDVPLLAFLLPFSPELWIAIFTSLNVTAIAVAIYEWLSPFGLNPWGRQRSKNFSMSSALWVMWGLLCGHLVAFKAPKSWPNKFLINVWGGFSVIFVASYTANIAALIAGLFFHNEAGSYSGPLLKQRIGAPIATATEYYVQQNDKMLWEHMKKYQLQNLQEGIDRLKNGTLDLLLADSPILDYYRATDHGCLLQRVGDTYMEDSYAIGMHKGFPLKETISALISKYSTDGYLDILTDKWYGGLACFKIDRELGQPKPLGVAAVAGVFLLLSLGVVLGLLILIFEHLFYKYTLPILRHQPKNTIWKSRNIMFFSQKLYRFINCVELISPHHAAKELVHTIRQGQITSLFQKSIKRKEDEQRRRRKSKAQFFDMIQEIRRTMYLNRVQEQEQTSIQISPKETMPDSSPVPAIAPVEKIKQSPKSAIFSIRKHKSNPASLNVRRFSTDSILSERLDTIGRRLSRGTTNSPPDLLHRFETFGKTLNGSGKFDTYSGKEFKDSNIMHKYGTFGGKIDNSISQSEEKVQELPKKIGKPSRRAPLKPELYVKNKKKIKDEVNKLIPISERVAHGLAPPFIESDTSSALLRDKLHEELRLKYGSHGFSNNDRKSKT